MKDIEEIIFKAGVALDWILSGLIFLSVLFFVIFNFMNLYPSSLHLGSKNEDPAAILLCKERYLLYVPVCNKIFVVLEDPLYSSSSYASRYKYAGKQFYFVYANSSQVYSIKKCNLSNKSDIVFSSAYINNSLISFDLINGSLFYNDSEVLKVYNSTYAYENNHVDWYKILKNLFKNEKIIFPPFAPQIIIFSSKSILLNITEPFNYIYHDGKTTYINGTGKVYEDTLEGFCLKTSSEICVISNSYMRVKVYNYTSNNTFDISVEIEPYNLFASFVIGSEYEKCVDEEIFQPVGFYYIYDDACLSPLRDSILYDIEVKGYDGCGNVYRKVI